MIIPLISYGKETKVVYKRSVLLVSELLLPYFRKQYYKIGNKKE